MYSGAFFGFIIEPSALDVGLALYPSEVTNPLEYTWSWPCITTSTSSAEKVGAQYCLASITSESVIWDAPVYKDLWNPIKVHWPLSLASLTALVKYSFCSALASTSYLAASKLSIINVAGP